ncbi:flagellar hook-basal body protein, FlgE/F/G [Candidatus Magnetoovum chiemensis]|nr:flagellar hook-basal body protein, FlgE/F/G [Candidatus Magnetoovum chiemensis]
MITSLYSALSGLRANGYSVNAAASNIANIQTPGYKSKSVTYSEAPLVSQGGFLTGSGVQIAGIDTQFTNTSYMTTNNPLDLALNTDGFFIVKDTKGQSYYTRSGNFTTDKDGYLVSTQGYRVQGYINGTLSDIKLNTNAPSSQATSEVNLSMSLNANDEIIDKSFEIVNNTPRNYNSATTITVYDQQGESHEIQAYFTKTDYNQWNVNYVTNDNGTLIKAQNSQTLTFNQEGTLTDGASAQIDFAFSNDIGTQTITFNYSNNTRQLSTSSQVLSLNQDGSSTSIQSGVYIGSDGTIRSYRANGTNAEIGAIAIAQFNSPGGLNSVGSGLYTSNQLSGEAVINEPLSGSVLSGALETSNVDLANQFVNMIVSQRAFEADIKAIRTSDEMMQDLLDITV